MRLRGQSDIIGIGIGGGSSDVAVKFHQAPQFTESSRFAAAFRKTSLPLNVVNESVGHTLERSQSTGRFLWWDRINMDPGR
jgi:hypothetical protein